MKNNGMWRRTVGVLSAAALLTALAAGCGGNGNTASDTPPVPSESTPAQTETVPAQTESAGEETRTIVDLAGREVTIPANVTKVASLTGPSYETVIMLGAEDQVVITGNSSAQSGWAHVVSPEYADIPAVQDATSPNVEELMDLGVEVVLFWDSYPDVIEELESVGIAVVVTQLGDDGIDTAKEFVDLKKREIMAVGEVFGGEALERAQAWCDYVDETVAYVTERTGQLAPEDLPSVYYVRGPESLSIHGGESYTRYLVDMAGGDLVSKDDPELLYTTTMEQVLEWNPEYIFMGRVDNVELVTEDPAFAPVQAVKDGNVYVNLHSVGPADYSTDCFLMMEQIAKILHPDLFEDLDMVEATKAYFRDFYDYELTDEQANQVLNYQGPEA